MALPDDTLNGVYGFAGYNFFDMVSVRGSYQYMTGDNTYQDLSGKFIINDKVLASFPYIYIVEAYY